MNKITLINGSPKYNNSASEKYLDIIYQNLDQDYVDEEIDCLSFNDAKLNTIKDSDILIFAFPLYIDSLPSHFIKFLVWLEENDIKDKLIYTIINCGYYEGIHNLPAMHIMENFCNRISSKFMGGIGIGCGPIGFEKRLFNTKIQRELKKLANKISYQSEYVPTYPHALFPRFIYLFVANISWYRQLHLQKK